MPPKPSRVMYQVSKLMRHRWFRAFVLATSGAPKTEKYCKSVPSDVADGRRALVSGTKNAALFVADLDRSREFYMSIVNLNHLKTGGVVDHPYKPGFKVQVCALGFGNTPDLMLVRQTDQAGNGVPVADNGLHHVAFRIESTKTMKEFATEIARKGFQLSYGPGKHYPGPGGDGGWGGNAFVYVHDPDGHFVEFFNEMDPFGTMYELRGR